MDRGADPALRSVTMSRQDGAETGARPGLTRLAAATLPSPSTIVFGSAAWGLLMAACAMTGIWLQNRLIIANPLAIASVYFYGGSLAFAPALWLARLVSGRLGRALRSATGAAIMALATHLLTAAMFALQYRVFYAHWHADFPDIVWFFQLAFTSAGAAYTFTVGSLTFYWPMSCLAIVGFGLWFGLRDGKAH